MFLAIREIRFAKGRFALMTGVVALVTLLIVLLSSLTRGLGTQNTSAVQSLPATRVLLAPSGQTTSWGDSVIGQDVAARFRGADPLVVGRARLALGERTASAAVMGTSASRLPQPLADDQVVLPRQTADDLQATVGSTVSFDGTRLVVAGVEPTRWYSHSPVVWTSLATAQQLTHAQHGQVTALLATGDGGSIDAQAAAVGLTSLDASGALKALPGYSSENGSLTMIQAFLYGICALVVIAFLSVWTIQRTRDIAVLRALGASRRYVLGDSLGQASILLAVGAAVGALLGTGIALAARSVVPVLVLPSTTVLPGLGVALVGLLGSIVAVRRVTTIDPLLALGGN